MTKVRKIMRGDVVGLSVNDPIEKACRLMVEQALSALPVVETDGRLIGILTDGEVLAHSAPRPALRWWQVIFRELDQLARDYCKAMGTRVGEVMTSTPPSIEPGASLEEAAALMRTHDLGVLPVVSHGEFVGLLTRAAVIGSLLETPVTDLSATSDAELESEMYRRLRQEPWVSSGSLHVRAHHGIVSLYGLVDSQTEGSALETMARAIPGCTGVETHLLLRAQVLRW